MGEGNRDLHADGGLYSYEINSITDKLEARIRSLEKTCERLIALVDKQADAMQGMINFEKITEVKLDRIIERGDERHEQNQESIKDNGDKIDRLQWWMLGAAVMAAGGLLMQIINMGGHPK